MIDAADISYRLDSRYLVHPVSIRFYAGEMVAIMGANGAGKSTLLKLLTGALKLSGGSILYKGKELSSYSMEELATERAVLSQSYQLNFPVTVADIIMMGRYPYFTANPSRHDEAIAEHVVQTLGVKHLLDRDYNTLSGGEAQKVQMARVLAQVWQKVGGPAKALYLDEPVSSLDMKYQHEILHIARRFAESGNAVITVLHDINLALQYADRIHFMREGNIVYSYTRGDELDLYMLKTIFDIEFENISADEHRRFIAARI